MNVVMVVFVNQFVIATPNVPPTRFVITDCVTLDVVVTILVLVMNLALTTNVKVSPTYDFTQFLSFMNGLIIKFP